MMIWRRLKTSSSIPEHPRSSTGQLKFETNFEIKRERSLTDFSKKELQMILHHYNIPKQPGFLKLSTKSVLFNHINDYLRKTNQNHPVDDKGVLLFLPTNNITARRENGETDRN